MTRLCIAALYLICQTACCLRIIYPNITTYRKDRAWFNNADWFNLTLPRCSSVEIQKQCEKYGAKKCESNLQCTCECPLSNATLSYYGFEWQCTSYTEIKRHARCRFKFDREDQSNQIVYLPTGTGEKALLTIPKAGNSCTINISSSRYLTCNATWSPITGVNGATNTIFHLLHHLVNLYIFKVNLDHKPFSLGGKIIKLVLNCNSSGDGEPCVLFKLKGYTDCGGETSRQSSCQVHSSDFSRPQSSSKKSSLPTLNLNSLQASIVQNSWSTISPQPRNTLSSTETKQVQPSSLTSAWHSLLITGFPTSIKSKKEISPTAEQTAVSSVSPTTTSVANTGNANASLSRDVIIIGAAAGVGGVLLIIPICAVFVWFHRRKRRNIGRGKRMLVENQAEQEQQMNEYSLQNISAYEEVDSFVGDEPAVKCHEKKALNPATTNDNDRKGTTVEKSMYEEVVPKQLSKNINNDLSSYESVEHKPVNEENAENSTGAKDSKNKVKEKSPADASDVPDDKAPPAYASADMEQKMKRRKERNKNPFLEDKTKEKEYAAPELPPCVYANNDLSERRGPHDKVHYEEIGESVLSNAQVHSSQRATGDEYAEPQVPIQYLKDASKMADVETITPHYEPVETQRAKDSKNKVKEKSPADASDVSSDKAPPAYASVDMRQKIKRRKESKENKNPFLEDKTKEKEYAAPELPSCVYATNDFSERRGPHDKVHYEIGESLPSNTQVHPSQGATGNEYAEPQVPTQYLKDASKMADVETITPHYEQVEPQSKVTKAGFKNNLPLRVSQNNEYDNTEGIILDDGRSVSLSDGSEVQQKNSATADHCTAATREPIYHILEDNPPVLPTARPEIEGYDVPEQIISDDGDKSHQSYGVRTPFDIM